MLNLLGLLMPKFLFSFADEINGGGGSEPTGVELLEKAMNDLKSDEIGSEGVEGGEGGEDGAGAEKNEEVDPLTGLPKEKAEEDAEVRPKKDAAPPDDPEVDVELDGKKVKVKMSDLKKGYMQEADYTRKMQEFSKSREEIAPVLEFVNIAKADPKSTQALVTFVENFILDDGKPNVEFMDKFIAFAQGKAPEQKINFQDPEFAAALSDIDPESEIGKVLTTIMAKNQSLEKMLTDLKGGLEKKESAQVEAQKKEQYDQMVTNFQTVYKTELNTLGGDKGKYKFISDKAKAAWEKEVWLRVSSDQTEFTDDAGFRAVIQKHADEAYKYVADLAEGILASHLKHKKTPLPVSGANAGGDRPPAGEYQKGLSLQDNIENMLKKAKEEH